MTRTPVMSAAVKIGNVEPKQLDWLEIQDDNGTTHRYVKGESVSENRVCHVTGTYNGSPPIVAGLARDSASDPILQQDEPGLPETIVVDYISGASGLAYWQGKVE